MDKNIYKINRTNLLDKIKDDSVVILFAGNAPKKTADEAYRFTPNRNFYYLTGVEEENHILVMSKIDGVEKSILFIKDIDLELEKWIGKSLRKDEALEITAVDEVMFKSDFEGYLHRLIAVKEEFNLYLDLERDGFNSPDSISQSFAKEIISKYPQIRVRNIYGKIASERLVKSEEEIENIKKAIEITIAGVENLMKNAKAGMKEYELEAYFDFNCKSKGVKDLAFNTIAAAGKNATVLHYVDNDSEIKDGDLILFDLGAQYKYYNADISRTFPVSGKFTKRQKEVYNAVLSVNEEIIKMIKPGVTTVEINERANDLLGEACVKLGLLEDKKDFRKYYFHSIGHSLGLDTHDIVIDRNFTFAPGMVYTVEPGLYIPEESIGIRIEDDILVTEDGCINLTKNMIKTVEEIENFMKN